MHECKPPRLAGHYGTVTRKGTPRQAPALAYRLRVPGLYLWLVKGRKAVCACGWHAIAPSNSAADTALAAHVISKGTS